MTAPPVLLLAAMVLAPAVAAAKPPEGPRVIEVADLAALQARARCLVAKGPRIEQILTTDMGSPQEMMLFMEVEPPTRCFRNAPVDMPKVHPGATRGAIIEALLLRDFSAIGRRRGAHVATTVVRPAVDLPRTQKWARAHAAARSYESALLAVGECTVRSDPTSSFALFGTDIGSPEEKAAIQMLTPALSQCLPQGFEFNMRIPAMRSVLAEAAYRVSASSTQQVGG
ncbi:MAG: hypothetical protein QOH81_2379 [Sphingomonadales bacterium]|jgi:hypothetical protein|nr:hypothetical protein [Sphingomonadales bacterium]